MRRIYPALLGLAFGVASAFGDTRPAGRVIRVTVVDTGFQVAWRAELNRKFYEHVSAAIRRQAGDNTVVCAENVDARTAVTRLDNGGCDAVMIVGPERPRAFRRLDLPMQATHLGPERNFEPVYLIVASGDATIRRCVSEGVLAAVANSQPIREAGATRPVRALAADRVATSETPPTRRQD